MFANISLEKQVYQNVDLFLLSKFIYPNMCGQRPGFWLIPVTSV